MKRLSAITSVVLLVLVMFANAASYDIPEINGPPALVSYPVPPPGTTEATVWWNFRTNMAGRAVNRTGIWGPPLPVNLSLDPTAYHVWVLWKTDGSDTVLLRDANARLVEPYVMTLPPPPDPGRTFGLCICLWVVVDLDAAVIAKMQSGDYLMFVGAVGHPTFRVDGAALVEVHEFSAPGTLEFTYTAGPICPADLNGDGVVNVLDFIMLLSAWGACGGCPADLNGDGVVNFFDLDILCAAWGPC